MFYETFVKVAPCIIVVVVVWIFCVCILCPSIGKLITDYKKRLATRMTVNRILQAVKVLHKSWKEATRFEKDCEQIDSIIFEERFTTKEANATLTKLFYVNQSGLIDIRKTSNEDDFLVDDPRYIVGVEESELMKKIKKIKDELYLKRLSIIHYKEIHTIGIHTYGTACGLPYIVRRQTTISRPNVTCKTCQRTKIFRKGR